MLRQPPHRAQPVARRAGGRKAVGQAAVDIAHAAAQVERQQIDMARRASPTSSLPPPPCLTQVGRQFGGDQRELPGAHFVEADVRAGGERAPPRRGHGAVVGHLRPRSSCFQRAHATRVPLPSADSMLNSLHRRLAPPRPRPRPLPVVKPSRSAASMSLMPGPWSSKVRRTPRRGPATISMSTHAAAAVVQRVARQLAGRGDDLGLVDQAQAGLDRQRAHTLPNPHHIFGAPDRRRAQSLASSGSEARRGGSAPCPDPRPAPS